MFAAYVTARAHALFDFRLYLPKAWCGTVSGGSGRTSRTRREFTTKPALGTAMITAAADAGVPFAWAAADEVYGRSSKLREACEKAGKGYVLAVPVNFTVTLPSGRKTTVAAVARLVPAAAWETRSCGPGCKGHRDYAWAWAATASPRHWVLIRRSMSDPADLAFYYCHAPGGPAGVAARADQGRREAMARRRMPAAGKGAGRPGPAPGPDLALLPPAHRAVHVRPGAAGRRRRPPGPAWPKLLLPPASPAARCLARHREAARQRDDRPPGDDPGLVKVSVPEARRLLRLATAPMTRAARDLGYAWSRWRRRHQARARWHHYHARLKAAQVT